ncbi:hypothetical protein [Streptacidiphilus rugosus]|uniref:hypothetical protein n=1 Tax=Streptacidiphilus rugosus TaxID=405783 RepID=UPI00068B8874|nr:hypothetical protein [Streptacidiphilus rugosus]
MNRRSTASVAAAILVALALSGLTACGSDARRSTPSADGQPSATTPTAIATSPGPTTGTPSATATSTAPPASAAPRPVSPPPNPGSRCLSGTVDVTYPGGDNPPRGVCVHVGTRIEITLHGTPGHPWRAVTTSAPQIIALTADTVAAGSVRAGAQAVGAGTAVLSATTRAASDPTGPMTQHWQLTITVVP